VTLSATGAPPFLARAWEFRQRVEADLIDLRGFFRGDDLALKQDAENELGRLGFSSDEVWRALCGDRGLLEEAERRARRIADRSAELRALAAKRLDTAVEAKRLDTAAVAVQTAPEGADALNAAAGIESVRFGPRTDRWAAVDGQVLYALCVHNDWLGDAKPPAPFTHRYAEWKTDIPFSTCKRALARLETLGLVERGEDVPPAGRKRNPAWTYRPTALGIEIAAREVEPSPRVQAWEHVHDLHQCSSPDDTTDWHALEDELAEEIAAGTARVQNGTIVRINRKETAC
jgi:hypothetical protein